jgi:ADP-heptose:LPS heptosyltransferase
MNRDVVHDVDDIAVVRAAGIGDLVFALPALEALRIAYPTARITLLARASHAELLAARPAPVDGVEIVPPYGGVSAPENAAQSSRELDAFFECMQARRFDIALQLHGGGGNSNRFVARLGARVTAGSRAHDAPPLDRWIRYDTYYPEVLRCLEVVRLVGARPSDALVPHLTVVADDAARADALLARCARERPIAVLHPGATDPRRRWPVARFAAVGRALVDWGLDVVVSGTDDEYALAAAVADQVGCGGSALAGLMSLSSLVGVLAAASVVVANDTGPLHLAAAVGTPTVGIYWVGNALNFGMHGMHKHRRCISWQMCCPKCGRDCIYDACRHRTSFVTDVSVTDVLAATRDVLDVAEPARAPGAAAAPHLPQRRTARPAFKS